MNSRRFRRIGSRTALVVACFIGSAIAAAPVNAQEVGEPLSAGNPAPDFALVAATRDGIAEDSVRLEDFRGETLVLAFFFRARTKG